MVLRKGDFGSEIETPTKPGKVITADDDAIAKKVLKKKEVKTPEPGWAWKEMSLLKKVGVVALVLAVTALLITFGILPANTRGDIANSIFAKTTTDASGNPPIGGDGKIPPAVTGTATPHPTPSATAGTATPEGKERTWQILAGRSNNEKFSINAYPKNILVTNTHTMFKDIKITPSEITGTSIRTIKNPNGGSHKLTVYFWKDDEQLGIVNIWQAAYGDPVIEGYSGKPFSRERGKETLKANQVSFEVPYP